MSDTNQGQSNSSKVFNVPNQLTTLRLILSIVLFGFIEFDYYLTSLILFVIAAGTDWLDGYWARKYGQVTTLGRILDPFADKMIICGTYIFLAANVNSGLVAWMVVVVVGREMLVTVLRSYMEGHGHDFSANMPGKLKMVFQCFTAGASLYALFRIQRMGADATLASLLESPTVWLWWTLHISIGLTIFMTLYSGVIYVIAAARMLGPTENDA
jgi:CDP-diacylglycerol--glycerol-3-phosphate 3-phosphatidyltransferase